MALSGSLKNFNVLQLLALIDKTGKTGSLLLEHWGRSVTVFFVEGKVVKVKHRDGDLGAALLHSGKINQEQYGLLSPGLSETGVAEALAGAGIMSVSEVTEFARGRVLEDLFPLFTWTDGTFRMELNVYPEEGDILGSVELGTAVSRVRARIAEFQRLVAAIPSLDVPLTLVPEAASTGQVCLSAEEWRLVAATSQQVPLRDLAQKLEMDEVVIRKAAQRLISAGLAELPAVPEPADSGASTDFPARAGVQPAPQPKEEGECRAHSDLEREEAPDGSTQEGPPADAAPEVPAEKERAERSGGGLRSFFRLR